MQTIFLTGFMGAGKTTIGQYLAEHLQWPVYDTDQLIEQQTGQQIKEIFSLYGEERFRELETETLLKKNNQPCIVTTGGGIILKPINRELMKSTGTVIFLRADFDIIWERLLQDDNRPLVKNKSKEEVEILYNSRLPLYMESATHIVDTSNKSIDEIVQQIAHRLRLN
ncbi:shikimate kinase [Oikeobacillus pervagus]|uniref:Shikimate kinase n=1 Tax=Oikeobacillus pervagus TaxID=1325931 RepID=A0AAJ1WI06_9BACI|nr:shikimate kinase [Oikeobacillus pervagus]MDQ0213853.1 shikimate kinase [Oikeobacillus pervagus]